MSEVQVNKLLINYQLLDHTKYYIVPHVETNNTFLLRAPADLAFAPNKTLKVNMGIKFQIPEYIFLSRDIKPLPNVYPVGSIIGHMESISTMIQKNILLLGPNSITYDQRGELVVFIKNDTSVYQTIPKGENIIRLWFSITPFVDINLVEKINNNIRI